MNNLLEKTKEFFRARLFIVFMLGFASGVPLALISSVLTIRLSEVGIQIGKIGLFALVWLPYSFKFLWAPLLDEIKLPILHKFLGQRRSWMLLCQLLLPAFICLLGIQNPGHGLQYYALVAIFIAFLSATQDIVVDAYRINILPAKIQGFGASVAVFGYRAGLYIAGVMPLIFAQSLSWKLAYIISASFMVVGIVATLISPEPKADKRQDISTTFSLKNFFTPFKDLLRIDQIYRTLAFVVLFKLGDAMAGVLTNTFLLAKGFTKLEIVAVVKTLGLGATYIGLLLGGIIAYRLPIKHALFTAGILQMLSNLLFVYQDQVGHDNVALIITITGENIATGIGAVVMIGYLSNLCDKKFAATQYALFASLAAISRNILSGFSGFIADSFGWSNFFIISTIAAVPALLILQTINFKSLMPKVR
jgi:PAT family beta-lactamase induction signal transducer AmpG